MTKLVVFLDIPISFMYEPFSGRLMSVLKWTFLIRILTIKVTVMCFIIKAVTMKA